MTGVDYKNGLQWRGMHDGVVKALDSILSGPHVIRFLEFWILCKSLGEHMNPNRPGQPAVMDTG